MSARRRWGGPIALLLMMIGSVVYAQQRGPVNVVAAGGGIAVTGPTVNTNHQYEFLISSDAGGGGGVSSIIGTGATTCTPSTGASTCATPNTVSNGLTGAGSFTAHGVLIGEGTGAIASTGSGALGEPLIATGATTDPIFGGPVLAGFGGTGLSTIPAHGVMLGAGTSAVSVTGAGNAGQVFESNGTSADPSFTAFALNAPGTTGNVATSNGTDWVSSAPFASVLGGNTFSGVVALTTTLVTVASFTLTAIAGHLDISGAMSSVVGVTGTCPIGGEQISYGLSLDSTVAVNLQTPIGVNVPDSTGTSQQVAGGTIFAQPSVSAGSHTVRLLAQTSTAASPCNGAVGFVRVLSTSL